MRRAIYIVILTSFLLVSCTKEERQFKNAVIHYEAAQQALTERNMTLALEELNKAIEIYPPYIEAHIQRQWLRSKRVDTEIILKDYENLMRQNRKVPEFHFLYGRLIDDPDKQRTEYELALELDPNFGWGYFGLGWIEYKKKRYAQAKEQFGKAVSVDPENPHFLNNLGGTCFFLGQYDEAIEHLNKAREHESQYPRPYANLATVYLQRTEFDSAIRMLEHYLNLAPMAPDYEELSSKLVQLRGR